MSRAVPSQDSSPETFARLLSRLTQPPVSTLPTRDSAKDSIRDSIYDPLAEDYAVSVSISDTGNAALNATRKRAMAPVRVSGQTAGRGSEAGEISYERALRMHSRPRPVELSELPPLTPSPEKPTPLASQPSRVQAEAKAISALRRAVQETAAEKSRSPKSSATRASAHTPSSHTRPSAKTADSRGKARNRKQNAKPADGEVIKTAATSQPSQARTARKPSSSARPSTSASSVKSATADSAANRTATAASRSKQSTSERRKSPRKFPVEDPASPSFPSSPLEPKALEPSALALERSSGALALAQRQSIVSIRLNAIESEQLRQRAAESGISVSAYMRSCVLEAEHLRAQVKHALAELRASHTLTVAPRLNSSQLDSSRLDTAPALLSSTQLSPHEPSTVLRSGFLGFLSGVFAIVLGRFQR